ncbi:amino acid ABC transporter ATP-binding protein [Roseibium sp.]|uniref:amino acid ABC transporter ATP-binding protein n=1 Tax=Roseibium sp. TaxID=1936156 RepID=UPI003BAD64C0
MSHRLPILTIDNLHLRYGDVDALRGITLEAGTGEMTFLIGPSGSGKSSLLRCCNRLETPTSGKIYVDGEDITHRSINLNRVRRGIGMVFQSFNLYPHMSAQGNVMLALRKVLGKSRAEAEAIALKQLERVGLSDRAGHYPNQLSGGQQQRVAIARSLALEPKIMLFDEPTSALDPELVGEVLKVMRQLKDDGMTMLVVSHEMRFAKAASDHVVFMAEGQIVEAGPPAQIFDEPVHARTRTFLQEAYH